MKQRITLLVMAVSLAFAIVSCDRKVRNIGEFSFDRLTLTHSQHLFGDTVRPAAYVDIDIQYVKGANDTALLKQVDNIIAETCFGKEYATGEDMNSVAKRFANTYFSDYTEALEPVYAEDQVRYADQTEVDSMYAYRKTVKGDVMFYGKDMLVYKAYFTEYVGGAHGDYSTVFANIDLKTMKVLTLDDLFRDDYTEALTALLWEQLATDQKVKGRKELEDLGYGSTGDLVPVENFYLDRTGITFFYNVYELRPFSDGVTEIKLDYSLLSGFLKDDGQISQRMKAHG